MQKTDREKIFKHMDNLVDNFIAVDNDLFELCVKKEIISVRMKTNIEAKSDDRRERYMYLVDKITHRGPEAYKKLLEICNEHFPPVYQLLKKNSDEFISVHEMKSKLLNAGSTKLEPYLEKINVKDSIKASSEFHKHNKLETYEMNTKDSRGVLFLVNIINYPGNIRKGAEQDKKYLLELFHFMGFKIFYHEDIKYEKYKELIEELIKSNHLDNIECFVLGILTHGSNINNNGSKDGFNYLSLMNGPQIKIEEIYNRFNNVNCTKLHNTPKIFLFPFCRGFISDKALIECDSENQKHQNDENASTIPTISDMIICYATANGFAAHRDIEHGSWYIKSLYDTFCKHAHDTDFETMLKMIGADTIKFRTGDPAICQTSCYENLGFNKVLYFNPGYYGISSYKNV